MNSSHLVFKVSLCGWRLYQGGPSYEDIRSRMEVSWVPLIFLLQMTYLVSSQPQAILPVSIGIPNNSSVEQQQCGQFSTLCGTSAGFHGFCTHAEMGPAASPLICSADDQLCPGTGCTCCLGCIEKDCSSKGEGWGCYSEKDAASFPQGSCLFDGSCARTPGSPLGECGCCKKEVDPTPCVQSTECKYSFSGQVGLGGQDGVRQRLTQLGLRGFCGDRSWRGGDCFTNGPDGRSVCPRLTPMDAKACTCCKECLDTSCSSKGKQWSCFSKAEASLLPEGACIFDGSCPRTPNSPYLDSSCACCNPEYIPPCNQTERCKEAFPGSGLKGFCSNGQQGPTFHCCQETKSVCPFATSPGAPAARSAWTGLAAREKAGPATVRMKRLPCPKDRVSSMIPVPSLLGPLTLEPVPVAKMMSPPQHHLATQQINAKLPIQEQD